MRPTAGLIVEGDTEYLALPRLATKALVKGCPPLKAINLHGIGSHVEPIGIARAVRPKVMEHQAAGRRPIVVCIDREQREMTAAQLAKSVLDELMKLPGLSAGVVVAVADRAFESWLLADARGLHRRRVFIRAPAFHSFEGRLGKQEKKGVVELGELLGHEYAKTVDGPAVFEKVDFATARLHGARAHGSVSLDLFLRELGV